MSIQELSPAEARELTRESEDWVIVDVRSEQEFEAGHPEGAFNIPIARQDEGGQGLVLNPDFLPVMKASFGAEQKMVMVCAMGIRSMRACQMLAADGYQELVNMRAGYHGARDHMGSLAEAGWAGQGFETAEGQPAGQSYTELAAKRS